MDSLSARGRYIRVGSVLEHRGTALAQVVLALLLTSTWCVASAHADQPDTPSLMTAAQEVSRNHLSAAIPMLEQLVSVPKPPAGAYHLLSQAYMATGRNIDAVKAASHALDLSPEKGAARAANSLLLSRAYYSLYRERFAKWRAARGSLPGMYQLLDQMEVHTFQLPDNTVIVQTHNTGADEEFSALTGSIRSEADKLRAYLTLAEKHAAAALTLDPNIGQAHDLLGLIYMGQGSAHEARRQFAMELDKHGPSASVYLHQGEMSLALGDADEAVSLLRQAVQYDPKIPEAYAAMSTAYAKLNDDVREKWAAGIVALLNNQTSRARVLFDSAKVSDDPDIMRGRAMLALKSGRVNDALNVMKDAVKAHPDDAASYVVLGDIQILNGKLGDARRSYASATSVNPRCDAAWYGLGLVGDRENKPVEAIGAYAEAVNVNPGNPLALVNLAADEVDTNQPLKAIGHLRDYLQRFPTADNEANVELLLEQLEASS